MLFTSHLIPISFILVCEQDEETRDENCRQTCERIVPDAPDSEPEPETDETDNSNNASNTQMEEEHTILGDFSFMLQYMFIYSPLRWLFALLMGIMVGLMAVAAPIATFFAFLPGKSVKVITYMTHEEYLKLLRAKNDAHEILLSNRVFQKAQQ